MPSLQVIVCGPERAEEIHRVTQAAFEPHRRLDPPSGAGRESVEVVREQLAAGGGAIAELDGRPVGCLRWRINEAGDFHVRRVAVEPALQRQGVGHVLMAWAEREAQRHGCPGVFVGVRIGLPGNLAFYERLDYEIAGEQRHEGYDQPTWLALRKTLAAR